VIALRTIEITLSIDTRRDEEKEREEVDVDLAENGKRTCGGKMSAHPICRLTAFPPPRNSAVR